MQFRKTMNLVLVVMLAGAAFATLVPTASAQAPPIVLTVTLTAPSDNVKPLQGAITFQGTAKVVVDQTKQANLVGIPVSYKVTKAPAWASVVVSPSADVFTLPSTPQQQAESSRTFQVSVTATDQAPAFQTDSIEITATTTPSPPAQPTSSSGSAPITASFFGILDVQLAETIKVDRPQTPVIFQLKVTNFGNGATKVNFAVTDHTENLQVPVPPPVILQSKQAGGNQITAEVPLTVQTPYHNGYLNEVGFVTYKLTSNYQFDTTARGKGDESAVSVVVTTKGFYVPGLEVPLALALVGLAAIALRRRA